MSEEKKDGGGKDREEDGDGDVGVVSGKGSEE